MKIFSLLLAPLVLAPIAFAADAAPAAPRVVHCKVIQGTKPVYPVRLYNEGVTHGEARLALNVSAAGQLADSLVLAYTHKGFADEAVRTVSKWKFEPSRVEGEPVGTVMDVTFRYEVGGVAVIERYGNVTEERDMPVGQYAYQVCGMKQLDRIPTPVHVPAPRYPKEWADQGIKGGAAVDFYIDETGKARMPVVTTADRDELGALAESAVQEWQFAPPTRSGKPVVVRARQVFRFE